MIYKIGQKVHFVHLTSANKAEIIGLPRVNGQPGILLKYKKRDFVTQCDWLKTQSHMDFMVEIEAVKITEPEVKGDE